MPHPPLGTNFEFSNPVEIFETKLEDFERDGFVSVVSTSHKKEMILVVSKSIFVDPGDFGSWFTVHSSWCTLRDGLSPLLSHAMEFSLASTASVPNDTLEWLRESPIDSRSLTSFGDANSTVNESTSLEDFVMSGFVSNSRDTAVWVPQSQVFFSIEVPALQLKDDISAVSKSNFVDPSKDVAEETGLCTVNDGGSPISKRLF